MSTQYALEARVTFCYRSFLTRLSYLGQGGAGKGQRVRKDYSMGQFIEGFEVQSISLFLFSKAVLSRF